jgi:hypothetical protein
LPGLLHHFQCSKPHPLIPLDTPLPADRTCADGARLVGCILPPQNVSSATDKPRSRAFLTRASEYAQTLHERSFRNLWLPHLQLDELRTRLCCSTQVIWLAIDPLTKILPVLFYTHAKRRFGLTLVSTSFSSLICSGLSVSPSAPMVTTNSKFISGAICVI